MTIYVEKEQEVYTMRIEGRLDTVTSLELEKAVDKIPSDVTELILDMAKLAYISSAGLRVLLRAQKKMNKVGSMKLKGVCPAVMEIFEMTGFADILVIEQ